MLWLDSPPKHEKKSVHIFANVDQLHDLQMRANLVLQIFWRYKKVKSKPEIWNKNSKNIYGISTKTLKTFENEIRMHNV